MIDKSKLLRQVKTKQNILLGQSLVEQLMSSLYIFADLEEVMETARKARKYEENWEVIGLYDEMVPISLKVQILPEERLLIFGIQEVNDRGNIRIEKKDFEWHKCKGNFVSTIYSVELSTTKKKKTIQDTHCWRCSDCGYIAFDMLQMERLSGSVLL